jgi:cytochrome P450
MVGIPQRDWDLIRADTDRLSQRGDGSVERGDGPKAAALRLATYFVELVSDLRPRPKDNLTSQMIEGRVDGRKITPSEVVAFLFLVISAGNESTGKTLGNAWYHGWLHPDVKHAGLNGRAEDWAAETLRYDSGNQLTVRELTQDTVLHDTRLRAGVRIAILHGSANRDDRVFPDPDAYDLDRDLSKTISFGRGPHHCLGAPLARLEMRIALEEVSALLSDYEVDAANAQRVHCANQRGFASLPCRAVWR